MSRVDPPTFVDERKRMAFLELSAQNRLLVAAMEASPIAICIADVTEPDMPLNYVNAAFSRITGYSYGEAYGRNCRFLQGEGTDQATVDAIRKALAEHQPFGGDILNYRKDGTPFWNRLKMAPVFASDGTLAAYIAHQIDVTDDPALARL